MGGSARSKSEQERRRAEDAADRRFNETVRNLLNTPPKPHKAKGDSKPTKPQRRDAKRPAGR